MPSGVYKRSEKTLKRLRGLRLQNGQKEENNPEFFKETYEFLDKLKNNKDIHAGVVDKFKTEIKTVDGAVYSGFRAFKLEYDNMLSRNQDMINNLNEKLQLILNKAIEKKHKPIRKVWYLAIKAKEKDVKEYEELQDRWIEKMGTIFPEAKITKSLCGMEKSDVMTRNKLGQFELIKDKE